VIKKIIAKKVKKAAKKICVFKTKRLPLRYEID
jgi:hypothetical protein